MKKAFFYLHTAILLAGLTGILGKLIQLNEVLITFYRMVLAGIILLLVGFFKKQQYHYSSLEILKISSAGLLLGLHWIFFYGSIKYANVSVGVICFCLTGFFTAILAPLINRTKFSGFEFLLSSVTLLGVGLIFSFDTKFRMGIVLGIVSSFLVALFTIINEKFSKKYQAQELTKMEMLGGALGILLLLPIILYFYPIQKACPTLSDFLYLLVLVGACTILLYVLLNKALRYISAFTVSLSFNLEPLYAVGMAMCFFEEYNDVTIHFFIGLVLILMALVLQTWRVLKRKRKRS